MSLATEIFIFSLSVIIIGAVKLFDKNPSPIFNVYQRPNGFFWLKVVFMYVVISTRKWLRKLKKTPHDDDRFFTELDRPQKLSFHEKALDAVYFNGASQAGDHIVVATARRKNRLVDGFLYLLVPSSGLGLLEFPKLPGTALCQTEETDQYAAEGIRLAVVEPMKKWTITYEGKMKQHNNRKHLLDVKIDLEWTSTLPYFNMDTDINAWMMAKALATERWSREYFENLKVNHQTHYEQYGELKGTAIIKGKTYSLNIDTVRDHSFGRHREWRNFHRYILHFLTTANGDRINVSVISMPISFSCLTVGWVYSVEDKAIHAVTSCDLQLYQHGENGKPPVDYAFSFEAGGRTYHMQVMVLHSPHFYISEDWESKVVEQLCKFNVNGVEGWGAAEWQYRNVKGKKLADWEELER